MTGRALGLPAVSIAIVVVALAGCVHDPAPPLSTPVPATASSEELRWVIEAALAQRNWAILKRAPGSITAQVRSQGTGERAVIEIVYRPGTVDIRPVEQKVSRQRYDRWVKLLSTDILKSAAQLGMGRPPAPSPPPTVPDGGMG